MRGDPTADAFGYNDRGEVTAASIMGWSPSPATASYGYDGIGNLQQSTFNAATNAYTANSLNQYTSILCDSVTLCEPTYDTDGNMLTDGVLSFTYDAASRLKTVSSNGVTLVTNFYDAKSRRVKKVTPNATTTFFYDDWNLVEERIAYADNTSSTIRYFWGKDLSGTLQGAGGVGGLLWLTIDGVVYIPCYDNNGNITRYLNANGGTFARYSYDAFGRLIARAGRRASFFRHRFSTKYFDSETGLYYYGYRFYHPGLMRWLNRDPIEEKGGLNLYEAMDNATLSSIDYLGQAVYLTLAGIDPGRRLFSSCKLKMTMALRCTLKALIDLTKLTEADYRCLQRRSAVKFDGRIYTGTLAEYRNLIRHELDSQVVEEASFAGSVGAMRRMTSYTVNSFDQVVYVIHGCFRRSGVGYDPLVQVHYSDGYRGQQATLSTIYSITPPQGSNLVISCGQTWNGIDANHHLERIIIDQPELKLKTSCFFLDLFRNPELDYKPLKIRREIQ